MTHAPAATRQIRGQRLRIRLLRACAVLGALVAGAACWAAPPASGTLIHNQANTTFLNVGGAQKSAASNTVQVQVGQVAGFALAAAGSKSAQAATLVYFPHTLVNSGNGADRFSLSVSQLPGGLVFTALQIFSDADGDGLPDNPVPLDGTALLAAQATFRFVVAVAVPAGAPAGAAGQFRIDAASGADPARTSSGAGAPLAALVDRVELVGAPLLSLEATLASALAKPGDTLFYRLTLRNAGAGPAVSGPSVLIDGVAAAPLLVRDAIPANTTLAASAAPLPDGVIALYHRAGAAAQAYTRAPPVDLGEVDALAFALPALAPGASAALAFGVTLHANAASNGSGVISNTAQVDFLGAAAAAQTLTSNAAQASVAALPATLRNYTGPDYSTPADTVRPGNPLYLRADAAGCNVSAGSVERRSVLLSGPGGEAETVLATETGPNTGLFTLPALATSVGAVVANDGTLQVASGARITIELLGCGARIVASVLVSDPSGTLFNSASNAALAGAGVSLVQGDGAGGCSATPAAVRRVVDGVIVPAPSSVTTGADGKYAFERTDPGQYCLVVKAPAAFTFPSTLATAQLPAGRNIAAGGPGAGRGASYGANFSVLLDNGPVRIDLPLDPLRITGLFVEISAARQQAEIGDFLDYTIKVRNNGILAIGSPGVLLNDVLPAGFVYQRGSARRNGVAAPDPARSAGAPELGFALGALDAAGVTTLSYRVRIGPGALQGDATTRVHASAGADAGVLTSNPASAKVTLQGGVFGDNGFLVGKVYLDCNGNRQQDPGEAGIPGVRVYLEDGTYALSDGEGKYSFYGIAARSHVLKLDTSSLPPGTQLIALSNRHAGDAGSVFVDLKNGELMKADFGAACSPALMQDIAARRAKTAPGSLETERALRQKLEADGVPRVPGDLKAQAASGTIGGAGGAGAALASPFTPLGLAPALGAPAPPSPGAAPARPSVELETLLPELDNSFGFIGLSDGAVLPIAQTGVRIKGSAGARFELSVNGVPVPQARVGKKSVLEERQLEAWEFIGIALIPGPNLIEARQRDQFGKLRGTVRIGVTAPGSLAQLALQLPASAVADGHGATKVIVTLSDAAGVPVTVRTALTLEASSGRWQSEDLDPRTPGVQVFVEGGRGEFLLSAPEVPGAAQIRVSSGPLKAEKTLDFLPDLRPMIGAGLVEGVFNLRKLDSHALLPTRLQDGFEQQLTHFSRSTADGRMDAGARAALFLKGKVKGDTLLTLAYDSDKDSSARLFRDIDPDAYYPVYGDAAVRGFDAQSTARLYVRLDRDKSSLLYGDFTTQSTSEARKLANYSRSLTGARAHYENDRISVNGFASRNSTRQVVDELKANGSSGPYSLSAANPLANSEKVELLVRDRNQPGLVLKRVAQTRFVDYELEPLSGQLILKMPLPSLDPDFNPQSLSVTYEVEQGGAPFWVGGVDGQVKLNARLEVGALVVHDSNPQDPLTLTGVNASFKLAEKTLINAEVARNDKHSLGVGEAKRVQLRHDGSDLQVQAYAGRADSAFDNPGSSLARGRAESGLKMAFRLDPATQLKAEALRTADLVAGGAREGAQLSVERSLGAQVRLEAGLRHASESALPATPSASGATPNDFSSARARLSGQLPNLPQASVYADYEQDLHDSARKSAALGADVQLAGAGRLYLRHEFIASLSGAYALNAAQAQNASVLGIDVDYMKDGHVFSEYRIRDALAGADTEAALGLRNTWRLADGVALSGGFERVHTLAGVRTAEATALTSGIEYTASPWWKGAARLELRRSESSDNLLNTLGAALKLGRDWTALLRNTLTLTRKRDGADGAAVNAGGSHVQQRQQAGLAYRETDANQWNALARIEHRAERDDTQAGSALRTSVDIAALNLNYQPLQPLVLSARYGAKWVRELSNNLASAARAQLLGGRASYDLDARWNASLIANTLGGAGAGRQNGVGAEIGYLVGRNLWLAGGYNLTGFSDAELAGADTTTRGAFVRLRFKFDEDLLHTITATATTPP